MRLPSGSRLKALLQAAGDGAVGDVVAVEGAFEFDLVDDAIGFGLGGLHGVAGADDAEHAAAAGDDLVAFVSPGAGVEDFGCWRGRA